MKTILVATDFSSVASNATDYAADMALAIGANLLLLHVYEMPVSYTGVPVIPNVEEVKKNAEYHTGQLKNTLLNRVNHKLHIETRIRMGAFFEELEAVCQSIKPYAVVMGSQGATAAERFFLGSNIVYTVKNLRWPLITVPDKVKFSSIKKICLASDLEGSIDALPIDVIKILVKDFNAELHILNVGKAGKYEPEVVYESEVLRERLIDLKPTYHFISNEDIDEGIIDFTIKNQIDLLIVLPKHQGLINRLIHKSHTKQLVLHSQVPVMALHRPNDQD